MVVAGRPLEGVRSVGAVKWVSLRPATAARDRSPPSRHRSLLPGTDGRRWPTPGAGGRPLRRRREMGVSFGRPRLRGTASPPSRHRSSMPGIAGRLPGGRPLRRRREMVLVSLRPATAARDRSSPSRHRSLLPGTDGRRWPTPGGRPLRRRREMG